MRQIIKFIWILATILLMYSAYLLLEKCSFRSPLEENIIQPQETDFSQKKLIKWGAYTQGNLSNKSELQEKIGIKPDLIATFVLWGGDNYFPFELAENIKLNSQALVIYWESRDPINRNLNDKNYSYDAILSGTWDEYITSFGESIRESGAKTIIIPFIEMNGNWYPWSISKNGNSAEKHKLAYRKIHDMLEDIPNLQFGWGVNNGSAPDTEENHVSNLYPGDNYVDYIGVDGFNFGNPWQNFDAVFNSSLQQLRLIKKPIIIFSTASAEGNGKAEWIEEFGRQLKTYPEIEGFIWFNEDKERDWRIWSDPASLEAFKDLISLL